MNSRTESYADLILKPLQEFLRLEAAGGLVLMAAAVAAIVVANSPLNSNYEALLNLPVAIRVGTFELAKPLFLWINDGLMAVFFFLVGMELKREVMEGHLSSLGTASLPALAAAGGMLAPALIYIAFNRHDPIAMKGWAIPTATDIAFALGVLALLGQRIPPALKAFLLSIAIFDDIGAIFIIALFYTSDLSMLSLAVAAALIVGLAALNISGVARPAAYVVLGIPLWIAVLKSGVHATLAGIVLAMFIPLKTSGGSSSSESSESPLRSLEHALHPWVAFGILPAFAFANAGVSLRGLSAADVFHPVPLGIVAGLLLGKQFGITAICWLAVKLRAASLPEGVRWSHIYGVSLLCGIGFTMSLFVASLAFEQGAGAYLGLDRLGILVGSALSGLGGYALLRFSLR
ncbi:MAG: Na+/H+ antiporter NhaA [Gammaproteobacteria bacterium]|jgi:NhaA family Na+:H+ antiporter